MIQNIKESHVDLTVSYFIASGYCNLNDFSDARKNPFKGEFTIFAGLGDCVKLLENFHYSETDISYLRSVLPPSVEEEFYEFLQTIR